MFSCSRLTIDLSFLYEQAEKNNYKGLPVVISQADKGVKVTLSDGKGYVFKYFNGARIDATLNSDTKTLVAGIK